MLKIPKRREAEGTAPAELNGPSPDEQQSTSGTQLGQKPAPPSIEASTAAPSVIDDAILDEVDENARHIRGESWFDSQSSALSDAESTCSGSVLSEISTCSLASDKSRRLREREAKKERNKIRIAKRHARRGAAADELVRRVAENRARDEASSSGIIETLTIDVDKANAMDTEQPPSDPRQVLPPQQHEPMDSEVHEQQPHTSTAGAAHEER
ncbi:hypothetical protein KC887_07405, partial [Candidatus Kaiserbacteria bacterium]|nr:hypothetical protein [Candidatus Kaiserbacteria bacterium]